MFSRAHKFESDVTTQQHVTNRKREDGSGRGKAILSIPRRSDIWCFPSHVFSFFGGLTRLWVHGGSLPWIFLELDAFYREDGCSCRQKRGNETLAPWMFDVLQCLSSLSASVWTWSPRLRKYECLRASSADTRFLASNCRHADVQRLERIRCGCAI